MDNMFYKDYYGGKFDTEDDGLITGEVLNSSEPLTFKGYNEKELRKSFVDSINNHLSC